MRNCFIVYNYMCFGSYVCQPHFIVLFHTFFSAVIAQFVIYTYLYVWFEIRPPLIIELLPQLSVSLTHFDELVIQSTKDFSSACFHFSSVLPASPWLSPGDLDLSYWVVRNSGMDCMFLPWDDVPRDTVWARPLGSDAASILIMLVKSFWKPAF